MAWNGNNPRFRGHGLREFPKTPQRIFNPSLTFPSQRNSPIIGTYTTAAAAAAYWPLRENELEYMSICMYVRLSSLLIVRYGRATGNG